MTPYSSIDLKFILESKYFEILFNKVLFFLPPPQINISLINFSLFKINDSASPITLAEKAVNVAAPSSNESPLEKEMSKSPVSNESLSLLLRLIYSSCACSKIISLTIPEAAFWPSLSNF